MKCFIKIIFVLFTTLYAQQEKDNNMSKKANRSQGLLTNGVQPSGNLFSLDYPFIKAMKKALEIKIDKYKQEFDVSVEETFRELINK